MLKLYISPNSICTQKVLITLDEKSLDYEPVVINLFTNEQYDPAYLKLNPKGVVPTLVHDDHVIPESSLICEYLDEVFPEVPLVPVDAYQKTRMRMWSKLIDEQIFEATREISFSAHFRTRMQGMSEEQRQTRFNNVGDPERTARYTEIFEKGTDSHYMLESVADYEKAFKKMEADLGTGGGPWLLGADYSLADINMIPYVGRLEFLNLLDIWLQERPLTRAWWALALERPSTNAAIRAPMADKDWEDMQKYGGQLRGEITRIRDDYLAGLSH
ncbi:MAG: glutathione S-transferase family protein [Rhodospirillaceae bacterium]|jgi:glutathione S-transferase|nr:glutathione S-transferase family protein [Rhodospirillaceae bacterium]MBT3883665.1 glutathione S-transferase family protein [Rhodospirillaceae bacterium]MBT4115197.1 glutathione S-transferase family protein [Rhodospirillaceae bacterium]MBT4673662.1 glutathione S-transferase family protein [Rhodospirillaceae bacterium]MBT4721203.1 glutathione S-transferase family protein [Rhodospirillaceae bacterium]